MRINRNYLGHTLVCIRKDSVFCENGYGLIYHQPEVGEEVYCFADDGISKIRLRGYEEQPGKSIDGRRFDTWFNKVNFIKKSDYEPNEFKEVIKNKMEIKEYV